MNKAGYNFDLDQWLHVILASLEICQFLINYYFLMKVIKSVLNIVFSFNS